MDIKYEGKIVWLRGASERTGPSINNPSVGTLAVDTPVQGVALQIEQAGAKEWMQLVNGNWVATIYPNESGIPQARVVYQDVGMPLVRYEGKVVWQRGASERTGPSANSASVNTLPVDTPVQGVALSIEQAGAKEWMQLVNGNWVATLYPDSSGLAQARIDYHEVAPPPPSSGAPLRAVITMPDGSQWEATQFTKVG